jgi:hypothetical protein
MGYCMSQMDCHFAIKAENRPKALEAIKELNKNEQRIGSGGSNATGDWVRHFAWVRTDTIEKAQTLFDAMEEWGYEIAPREDTEDVDWIYFIGEKIGDEQYMFEAIAPFVEDGSWIQMSGEDGSIWRWVFRSGKCCDINGEVVFNEEGCW